MLMLVTDYFRPLSRGFAAALSANRDRPD